MLIVREHVRVHVVLREVGHGAGRAWLRGQAQGVPNNHKGKMLSAQGPGRERAPGGAQREGCVRRMSVRACVRGGRERGVRSRARVAAQPALAGRGPPCTPNTRSKRSGAAPLPGPVTTLLKYDPPRTPHSPHPPITTTAVPPSLRRGAARAPATCRRNRRLGRLDATTDAGVSLLIMATKKTVLHTQHVSGSTAVPGPSAGPSFYITPPQWEKVANTPASGAKREEELAGVGLGTQPAHPGHLESHAPRGGGRRWERRGCLS